MQSRRQWMRLAGTSLLMPTLAGCTSMTSIEIPDDAPEMNVDPEVHWARRQEWQGEEVVFGVVGLTQRYLMVKHKSPIGWTFPGGVVNRRVHGPKMKANEDLYSAAVLYTYDQALIALEVEGSGLFAYGYAIDPLNDRTVMVHWYRISPRTPGIPSINANLGLVDEVRWVSTDASLYVNCLRKRQQEYLDAGHGGTIILEPCV